MQETKGNVERKQFFMQEIGAIGVIGGMGTIGQSMKDSKTAVRLGHLY